MPELPEVEVVRAGLEPAATGAVVTGVTVLDERSLRRHAGPSEDFVERLTGATLLTPARRGKFLWLPLADPKTKEIPPFSVVSTPNTTASAGTPSFSSTALVVHLGMSGQVLLREPGVDDALTRIRIDLEHPVHGPLRLNFVDQRIFGSMALDELIAATDALGQSIPGQVAHIARDPIDPLFNEPLFLRRLAVRRSGIKRALLDQSLISGIGNIYADESLWASRIHGEQPANTLSRAQAKTLLTEVRAVLAQALVEGGTSFDTQYLNVNGESGYFAHSLRAYGQHGKPCPRCGRLMVREAFMNRNSHFCPFCQRLRASADR